MVLQFKSNSNVKGSGQECPLHTRCIDSARSLHGSLRQAQGRLFVGSPRLWLGLRCLRVTTVWRSPAIRNGETVQSTSKTRSNSKVKGSGQECPLHAGSGDACLLRALITVG